MSINLDVRMSVADLLEKVKEQREKHKAEYEKAIAGWREKMKAVAQRIVENAHKISKFPKAMDDLSDKPHHYLADFDEAIDALEMTKDTEIVLNASQFNQLVRGKWQWVRSFESSNSNYVGIIEEIRAGGAIAGEIDLTDAYENESE
jgi:hypothetical protein